MTRQELLELSNAEFGELVAVVDEELRAQNVLVPGRPLRGWLAFSVRHKLSLVMSEPVSQRVFDWFNDQYGEKLFLDHTVGAVPILIQGDLYLLEVPRIWGTVDFYFDAAAIGVRTGGFGPQNAFNLISGITPTRAKLVSIEEQRAIFETLGNAVLTLSSINDVSDSEVFISEARADIRAASRELTHHSPQYGAAKWSILQATEKFLKSYLEKKGVAYKKSHILADHASKAESAGLSPVSRSLLDDVQCEASVRYDSRLVSQANLIQAFFSGLAICAHVSQALDQDSPRFRQVRLIQR